MYTLRVYTLGVFIVGPRRARTGPRLYRAAGAERTCAAGHELLLDCGEPDGLALALLSTSQLERDEPSLPQTPELLTPPAPYPPPTPPCTCSGGGGGVDHV